MDTPGILTANSGAPLTVRTSVDCSLNGQGLDTADVAGDWHINQSLPRGQEILKWCNTSALALNPIGTVGNAAIKIVRGPALSNLDLAMIKNFQIKERLKLQFRAGFFNMPIHTVLGSSNTTFTPMATSEISSGHRQLRK